jgi:cytochrome c
VTGRDVVTAGMLAAWIAAPALALGPGDAVRGDQVYVRCLACHALAIDRVGPRHCGLFGRMAGSVPGFNYSLAMKNSHITWNDKTLDKFLTKPLGVLPGSAMTYDGIADPQERADLIAYLKQASQTPECTARPASSH